MKIKYRGFILEVKTAEDFGGETNTYYSAIRETDKALMINMYKNGFVAHKPIMDDMKQDIDRYYINIYTISYLVSTEKSMEDWLNDFEDWLENRGETIYGTIKPYTPERGDDDF